MRTALAIFDLDGTLVDSAPDVANAVNHVLRREYLPELPLESIRELIGEGARLTMARAYALSEGRMNGDAPVILPDHLLLDRLMAAYGTYLLAHCGSGSRVYPEVHFTLARLRAQGVGLAIVTNKEECFTRPLLAAHGLLDWFDPVVCGDTLPVRKPAPLPVQHCLMHYGVAPERTILVGDSDLDVRAARACGVRSLLVSYGYGATRGAACEPDAFLHSFADVLEYAGCERQRSAASRGSERRTADSGQ